MDKERKHLRQVGLHPAFFNPLLSHVMQFLPLIEVFRTACLVCSLWAKARFNMVSLKITGTTEFSAARIIEAINLASVKVADLASYVNSLAPLLTNATHLCLHDGDGVDLSTCHSLKYLYVLDGEPKRLPQSLVCVGLNVLRSLSAQPLPNLKALAGFPNHDDVRVEEVLKKLRIEQGCFQTGDGDRINTEKFPSGWSFALYVEAGTPLAFLDHPRSIAHNLHSIVLSVETLTLDQLTTLATFSNVAQVTFYGETMWVVEAFPAELWPSLIKVEIRNPVPLEILVVFTNAPVLQTMVFNRYAGSVWFQYSEPYFPQVTSVAFAGCDLSFIQRFEFEQKMSINITWYEQRIRENRVLLENVVLPEGAKVHLDLGWWQFEWLQTFLDHNEHAKEVSLSGHGWWGSDAPILVVPGSVMVVLVEDMKSAATYSGYVSFVEELELDLLRVTPAFQEETYREFRHAIKALKV